MRLLFFLFLLPFSAQAFLPQIKISYYKPTLPTNWDFLKISTAEYQVEVLYNIHGGLNVFTNGSYLNHLKEKDVRLYPITCGVKYVQPVARLVAAYGYTGPRVYYFQQSGIKGLRRSKLSGVFGGGFLTYMSKHWCLDTFGEWSTTSTIRGVAFGGWNVGTGFAYIF